MLRMRLVGQGVLSNQKVQLGSMADGRIQLLLVTGLKATVLNWLGTRYLLQVLAGCGGEGQEPSSFYQDRVTR